MSACAPSHTHTSRPYRALRQPPHRRRGLVPGSELHKLSSDTFAKVKGAITWGAVKRYRAEATARMQVRLGVT